MTHGSDSTYTNHGCRCQPCRDAHAMATWEGRATRAERLAANPDLRPHGRYATYNDWGCRCEPCVTEARAHWRRQKNRSAA